jgi:predicted Kef-type K+ transport protein
VKSFIAGTLVLAFASAAMAQKLTVQSLLADGYAVVGVMPSNAGPGIFLSKGQSLIVCFAAETPKSEAVETRYCKPVR